MDPLGFLKENEEDFVVGHIKKVGLKVKVPEPTRFGDWERKGRCKDF